MRDVEWIVVHCSDSQIKEHDDIKVIRKWHISRGFRDVGYHYFIRRNGDIQLGRNLHEIGAHVSKFNDNSIGICLSGRSSFTKSQITTLKKLLIDLSNVFNLDLGRIKPHNYFNRDKTCPNFNVDELISEIS